VPEKQFDPASGKVFVFGSNRAGIHGKGAALYAKLHLGALIGIGEGPMPGVDHPRCYGLPTKDSSIKALPLSAIAEHVETFLRFARCHDYLEFFVTRVGCGLAGYKDDDISPLFRGAPSNCELPEGWLP